MTQCDPLSRFRSPRRGTEGNTARLSKSGSLTISEFRPPQELLERIFQVQAEFFPSEPVQPEN